MYTVIIGFHNGEFELDRTYSSKEAAEKRAGNAGRYYKPFGGVAFVLPVKMARKLQEVGR